MLLIQQLLLIVKNCNDPFYFYSNTLLSIPFNIKNKLLNLTVVLTTAMFVWCCPFNSKIN